MTSQINIVSGETNQRGIEMKKQLPAILLGIACIGLLAAYIHANNSAKQLQHETAQLKNQTGIDAAVPETDAPSIDQTNSAVSGEPVATLEAAEPAAEEAKPDGRRMMENMAKMMENPTMNKVMEASQRGAIGALYTDLIAYLNLNEEETKYFMDLLMYRQMKQVDMAMKMMGGQLSDEEKKVLEEQIKQAQDTVKEEMQKFLNSEEDFAEFEYYEKTIGERMMLSQMDKDLSGSGAELSDTTYRELLGVMHDERENFDFTSDLNDQENADLSPERFSKDNVQNFANDLQQLNENIFQKAQGLLTPEQYDAFVSSLKAFTDMQLSQMEMAAQMFRGSQ